MRRLRRYGLSGSSKGIAWAARLGLPGFAAAAPPPGVSFLCDWERGITGRGAWRSIQVMAADRFQRVTHPVRHGRWAIRVEVRPGDSPIEALGDRAEVLIMRSYDGRLLNENESSRTQYYAFSVMLEPDWQPPAPSSIGPWGTICQLHGPDSLSAAPSFCFHAVDRFSVMLHGGNLDSPTGSLTRQYYPLTNDRLKPGQWVDFVVKIGFAKEFTGSVDVWRRDAGETDFSHALSLQNVPTLQYRASQWPVGDHYWKWGYYRAKQTSMTNVLWLGAVARGTAFDTVASAAFPSAAEAKKPGF